MTTNATLEELQATAEPAAQADQHHAVLPGLLWRRSRPRRSDCSAGQEPLGALLLPVTMGLRSVMARWRLERSDPDMVVQAARQSPALAAHGCAVDCKRHELCRPALGQLAAAYASTAIYVKIFSLWHVAHVPFFIMTLVAGIVHVISVTVY